MQSRADLNRIRIRGPQDAEELCMLYASETGMKGGYFDGSNSMAELLREKGGAKMNCSGRVEDPFYRHSESREDEDTRRRKEEKKWARARELTDLRAHNAHLVNRLSQLENRVIDLAENQKRAQSNHQLQARILMMEQAANAKAYLKPPKPYNPPFNPGWDPSAPNFIIYGGGQVEILRNGGEQDPMVGSPPQERVPVARLG